MTITTAQILSVMPNAQRNAAKNTCWVMNGKPLDITTATVLLNRYAEECGISTALHWAHYLATIAVESGELRYSEENLNYSAAGLRNTWPRRFPTTKVALGYQYKPKEIANYVYAWRNGNGNEESGDGWRYRGRGLIQYTGKYNYQQYAKWCGYDVVSKPDLLSQRVGSFRSAAHYFGTRCLALAAKDDIKGVRKAVNGGLIGLDEYKKYLLRAKKALGIK